MKKVAFILSAAALMLVSCGGHTLCPAYSSVKKVQDNNTAMAFQVKKEVRS